MERAYPFFVHGSTFSTKRIAYDCRNVFYDTNCLACLNNKLAGKLSGRSRQLPVGSLSAPGPWGEIFQQLGVAERSLLESEALHCAGSAKGLACPVRRKRG